MLTKELVRVYYPFRTRALCFSGISLDHGLREETGQSDGPLTDAEALANPLQNAVPPRVQPQVA